MINLYDIFDAQLCVYDHNFKKKVAPILIPTGACLSTSAVQEKIQVSYFSFRVSSNAVRVEMPQNSKSCNIKPIYFSRTRAVTPSGEH